MTDRDALAREIEAEINCWRGANGGVFTIHACALSVASITLRHIAAARAEAVEEAAAYHDLGAHIVGRDSMSPFAIELEETHRRCAKHFRSLMEPPA